MTVETIPGHHRADSATDVGRIGQPTGEVIHVLGEDPGRKWLPRSPIRVARMYAGLFEDLRTDREDHLMPFHGFAAISYIPVGRGVVLSNLAQPLEAEHRSRTQRGAGKACSSMVTSATRGQFRQRQVTRAEFPSLVRHS